MSTATSEEQPDISPETQKAYLWELFEPYKYWFLAGAICLILTNWLKFMIPEYIGRAVQLLREATGTETGLGEIHSSLIDAAIFIMVLAAGAAVVRIMSRIFIFNAGRYIEFDIRNRFYKKLTELTPAFFGEISTGDLTSRSANDIKQIRLLFAVAFLHIVNTTVAFAIALTRMAALDWQLTLVCLLPYPLLLLILRYLVHALYHQNQKVQSQLSDISSKVQESLNGMGVIKPYAIEDREKSSFQGLNTEFFDKVMKLATLRGGLQSLMGIISGVGTLLVLVVGTGKVINGTLQLGAFVEFNGYVVALAYPTISMGWVFSIWHRGLASFDRLVEIFEIEPVLGPPSEDEAEPLPELPDKEGCQGEIEFENVSFKYPDDNRKRTEDQALTDVDLELPAGSTAAIVGPTGAGKTTLVKLLARFYDCDSGSIRLDGRPIDKIPLRQLRSEIGFVPQEPFLFSMTVRDNIRFGLDAYQNDDSLGAPRLATKTSGTAGDSEDPIEEVARLAGLGPDIERFEEGLDTLVGERGVTLSGGQKQRITIARALLLDPRVLVLDDALSSVDTETESVILEHLEERLDSCTTLILTHRFNILDQVDYVYVMDGGRIIERGTHKDLLKHNSKYKQMLIRQQPGRSE